MATSSLFEKGTDRQEKPAAASSLRDGFVDQKHTREAAAWIREKVASTLRKGAEDVGEYVLDTFFAGDADLAKARTPNKNVSYRALAEKCGTPELPISKTWLNNAVGIAVMVRRLPENARAFRALPPSYQETLLPLRDPEKVEIVAKQATNTHITCRELRVVVADELANTPKISGRGRPRSPAVLKKLTRASTTFASSEANLWFTREEVNEMDGEQKRAALRSAESLICKLKSLMNCLRNS